MSVVLEKLNVSAVTIFWGFKSSLFKNCSSDFVSLTLLISSDKLDDETEEAEFVDGLYCPACDKFLKTEKA